MKINEFKQLEDKINNQNFNKGYKTINIVMTFLSYFGHVASIFLAYFILSKILSGAMTNNPVAVFIASIIILSGLELLKRDIQNFKLNNPCRCIDFSDVAYRFSCQTLSKRGC